ncbi:MAG: ABC transporter permease [Chloroflexota bacterium]|nr:ABC transporter permease [Chloroflexota bacterium]
MSSTLEVPLTRSAAPFAASRSEWRRAARVLARNRLVLVGVIMVVLVVITAVLAGVIAPYDPIANNVRAALQPPSGFYFFGTDRYGRDVFSRVVFGSQISLVVALVSVVVSATTGTLLGLASGFFGGWVDDLIGRVMDVLFSFPALVLAIAVAATLGPGITNAIIAISVVYAPLFGRVIRGPVLVERSKDYVEAARAMGAGPPRLILRHVFPNVLSPLIVQVTLTFSHAILLESYLSFLGLGTQPPYPSWGTMLQEGRTFLETAPWTSIFPGLAIIVAVLAFNLLGDGIRDVLDPRV